MLLIAAVLTLGVGYAVINNRILTATGTVPIAEKVLDVEITDPGTGCELVSGSKTSITCTFSTMDLSSESYEQHPAINVKNNESDLEVSFELSYVTYTDGDLNENISQSFIWLDGFRVEGQENPYKITLNPGETGNLCYNLVINETSIFAQYSEVEFVISFTVSPVL